jgi:exopolysaccharide biosynthesis polyprenyl glycosylphosphotransferase
MLKVQARRLIHAALAADGLTILGSYLLAFHLSDTGGGIQDANNIAWILLIIFPVWYGLFFRFGIYKFIRTRVLGELLFTVLKANAVGGIIAAAAIFLFEPVGYRDLFLHFIAIVTLAFLLQKTCYLAIVTHMKEKIFRKRQIVVVGTGEEAARFIRCVNQHLDWGLQIVGLIRSGGTNGQAELCGYKILGELGDLVDICRNAVVDEVVFCAALRGEEAERNLDALDEMGIKVRLVLQTGDFRRTRKEIGLFHGEFPILTVSSGPTRESHIVIKRTLDIVGSVVGLSILAVMLPFIAVAILLESGRPVLFGQDRFGENGRIIKCWKFRSMYTGAEQRKVEISHLNEMSGGMFKVRNDPRVTKVGQFLRKTSLDEWPQFWNVLQGEMSLVGPRPLAIGDIRMVENRYRRRLSVKPGITGLWQVSGRSEVTNTEDVVRLDLEYIDNWSLWLDCRILLKTCLVIFSGHGAY